MTVWKDARVESGKRFVRSGRIYVLDLHETPMYN